MTKGYLSKVLRLQFPAVLLELRHSFLQLEKSTYTQTQQHLALRHPSSMQIAKGFKAPSQPAHSIRMAGINSEGNTLFVARTERLQTAVLQLRKFIQGFYTSLAMSSV